jgi:hypothetical protein
MLHTKNYSYNKFAVTGANKFANTSKSDFFWFYTEGSLFSELTINDLKNGL